MEAKTISSENLPKWWKYDGVVSSANPSMGGGQVLQATRVIPKDGGSCIIRVQAQHVDKLVKEAEDIDRLFLQAAPEEILMSRRELQRILVENSHQSEQVTSLQKALTLKEEQLRAHRRVTLPDDQASTLKHDLERTTNEVLARYAPKAEPPPKTKSGEFILACPTCANPAFATPAPSTSKLA